MMNLDVFSTPIKANIAYLYRLHGDELTFSSFDVLPHHIGIRTLEHHTGFEPVSPAWKASILTTRRIVHNG